MKTGKQTKEKIYECEVKCLHIINGARLWKWIRREVSLIHSSDRIRCLECKGRTRRHAKKVAHGPRDHVEHIKREDSEGCPLGFYYLGVPRLSNEPVE